MSQRREFLDLAKVSGANITLLCKRFGISRKTGYKWINRVQETSCIE
ncbi:MAG: helix-turn-helix domain-containing protein, partial [Pirellula sp.]